MKMQTNEMIDITKIEFIKKWCEYKSDTFMPDIDERELLEDDIFILNNINRLYSLFNISNSDKNNHSYSIGVIDFDDYKRYKKYMSVINTFDIDREARVKLSNQDYEKCREIAKTIALNQLDRLNSIENFFIKSYTLHLIMSSNDSKIMKDLNNDFDELNVKQRKLIMNNRIDYDNFIEYKK